MPMPRERTVEYAILGDASGNVRVTGTDLVIFRLATGTGRPQLGRLSRIETGELVYNPTALAYSPTGQVAPVADQACLAERTGGRAPGGWRVVAVAPGA